MAVSLARRWHLRGRERYERLVNVAKKTVTTITGAIKRLGPEEIIPFHTAIMIGNIRKVEELLQVTPALLNQKDAGRTPLGLAVANENEDIVRFLLEKGADISAISRFHPTINNPVKEPVTPREYAQAAWEKSLAITSGEKPKVMSPIEGYCWELNETRRRIFLLLVEAEQQAALRRRSLPVPVEPSLSGLDTLPVTSSEEGVSANTVLIPTPSEAAPSKATVPAGRIHL